MLLIDFFPLEHTHWSRNRILKKWSESSFIFSMECTVHWEQCSLECTLERKSDLKRDLRAMLLTDLFPLEHTLERKRSINFIDSLVTILDSIDPRSILAYKLLDLIKSRIIFGLWFELMTGYGSIGLWLHYFNVVVVIALRYHVINSFIHVITLL